MNILITICARGGSKGIPGKNIKLLNGTPLLVYSINIAKNFKEKFSNVNIVLSTDSDEIITVAKNYGLVSDYKRPDYLANDTAGKVDAIKDVLLFEEKKTGNIYDYILDLDVTSPLRTIEDLTEAFTLILSDKNCINLFSVSDANRNPYFNMVEKKENGYYAEVKKPKDLVLTRQSAPKVYDMNASFYFYKRDFFYARYNDAITEKSLIYRMPHICFDLDHPIDFEIISFLLENDKLDFRL